MAYATFKNIKFSFKMLDSEPVIRTLLRFENYVFLLENGENIFMFQHPTIPRQTTTKSKVILINSALAGVIFGIILVLDVNKDLD